MGSGKLHTLRHAKTFQKDFCQRKAGATTWKDWCENVNIHPMFQIGQSKPSRKNLKKQPKHKLEVFHNSYTLIPHMEHTLDGCVFFKTLDLKDLTKQIGSQARTSKLKHRKNTYLQHFIIGLCLYHMSTSISDVKLWSGNSWRWYALSTHLNVVIKIRTSLEATERNIYLVTCVVCTSSLQPSTRSALLQNA